MNPNTATRAAASGRTTPIEATQPRLTCTIRIGKSQNAHPTAQT